MSILRLILGDQLSHDLSALKGADKTSDVILMMEVMEEANYVRHHKQKLVLIFAAMRHFAQELKENGFRVEYIELEDPENSASFAGEISRAIKRHQPQHIIATEPGEYRVEQILKDQGVILREDDRFFCSRNRFAQWAGDKKSLRMEFFYREMRKQSGLLMQDNAPEGGQWNYDSENRKAPPKGLLPPARKAFAPDAITQEVMEMVRKKFPDHFGNLDHFAWPVTRKQALQALDHFIEKGLALFGDYQDAMIEGEAFLWHSLLAPALNIGLLSPREICAAAEKANAPLNAREGFIRQILGWREYIRGIYWHKMPAYEKTNHLHANRPLPWFYWSGETKMNCMAQTIKATQENAYAHHIQRLMVTGNFALLAGLKPEEVEAWYLAVYADAFDWVELPNTHGMVLFADGGLLASKPYAASGAYINRMSNYCKNCAYDVKQKRGDQACPLNYLYWDFLIRNQDQLKGNMRLAMPYKNLARMSPADQKTIQQDAENFLESLSASPPA